MAEEYRIDKHKLMYHPQWVAELINAAGNWDNVQEIYPLYVEISPVGACNHRCTFCAVDYIGYQPQRLDESLLITRIREMAQQGVKSIMFAGEGEPLLHKGISRITAATRDAGIDVAFTTNATVLPKDFIDEALPRTSWLKASINAGTAETYAKVHQTKASDFELALSNLRQMVEARAAAQLDCTLGAQILLLPENIDEVETLAKRCRDEVGLDYLVVKPYSQHLFSLTNRYENIDYSGLLELGERLEKLNTADFRVVFRRRTMEKYSASPESRYKRCYSTPMAWAYVMADGRVFSCSAYLTDDRFDLGNLNEQSFQEIWQGEQREKNYQFVANELDIGNCRRNCRMDEVNQYLYELIEARIPHVNFI